MEIQASEEATRIVVEGRGKHFDPDVVDVYLRHVEDFVEISRRYSDEV